MQYTIIRQFKQEQPLTPAQQQEQELAAIPMTTGSLYYEWRYILLTRMKYQYYLRILASNFDDQQILEVFQVSSISNFVEV